MVGHRGSSAGSYLADPASPIPSYCASIVATSTLRVNTICTHLEAGHTLACNITAFIVLVAATIVVVIVVMIVILRL